MGDEVGAVDEMYPTAYSGARAPGDDVDAVGQRLTGFVERYESDACVQLATLVSIVLDRLGDSEFDHLGGDGWGSPPIAQLLAETGVAPEVDRGRRILRALESLCAELRYNEGSSPDEQEPLEGEISAVCRHAARWLPWPSDVAIVLIGLLPVEGADAGERRRKLEGLIGGVQAAVAAPTNHG